MPEILEGKVTISLEMYLELLDDAKWRDALEAGGVENWEYYEESLDYYGYFDEDE